MLAIEEQWIGEAMQHKMILKKTKFLNLSSVIFQETHNLHCWVWNTSARDR